MKCIYAAPVSKKKKVLFIQLVCKEKHFLSSKKLTEVNPSYVLGQVCHHTNVCLCLFKFVSLWNQIKLTLLERVVLESVRTKCKFQ